MLTHLNITDFDIEEILNTTDDDTIAQPIKASSDVIKEFEDISYNLSTMTICGRLGGNVNITRVIREIPIEPYWAMREGILRVEGYDDDKIINRGISRKYIEKKNIRVKPFRNSASLYCRIFDEETGIAKEPSIKIFRNGGFQVTGIRTPYQAKHIVNFVKDTLKKITDVFEETNEGFINVCMMNSDITLPYKINRSKLQQILVDKGILSTFETTSYQGINIKYYWNYAKHKDDIIQNGICECESVCQSSGKKRVMKNPETNSETGCIRITIAPFQTGKIIITGAKTLEQINDASQWIIDLIRDNHSDILMGKADPKKIRKKIPFRSGHTVEIER